MTGPGIDGLATPGAGRDGLSPSYWPVGQAAQRFSDDRPRDRQDDKPTKQNELLPSPMSLFGFARKIPDDGLGEPTPSVIALEPERDTTSQASPQPALPAPAAIAIEPALEPARASTDAAAAFALQPTVAALEPALAPKLAAFALRPAARAPAPTPTPTPTPETAPESTATVTPALAPAWVVRVENLMLCNDSGSRCRVRLSLGDDSLPGTAVEIGEDGGEWLVGFFCSIDSVRERLAGAAAGLADRLANRLGRGVCVQVVAEGDTAATTVVERAAP